MEDGCLGAVAAVRLCPEARWLVRVSHTAGPWPAELTDGCPAGSPHGRRTLSAIPSSWGVIMKTLARKVPELGQECPSGKIILAAGCEEQLQEEELKAGRPARRLFR